MASYRGRRIVCSVLQKFYCFQGQMDSVDKGGDSESDESSSDDGAGNNVEGASKGRKSALRASDRAALLSIGEDGEEIAEDAAVSGKVRCDDKWDLRRDIQACRYTYVQEEEERGRGAGEVWQEEWRGMEGTGWWYSSQFDSISRSPPPPRLSFCFTRIMDVHGDQYCSVCSFRSISSACQS